MDAEIFIRYGGASAAMVRVFWELCVVFCDEVECRATFGHVTQSIDEAGSAPPNLARIFRVEVDDQRSFPLR